MDIIYRSTAGKRSRIYHRCGCIYAKRIKPWNRIQRDYEKVSKRKGRMCRYCAGLQGDIRIHGNAFASWSKKYEMVFIYKKERKALYIQTKVGFWKVFADEGKGKYVLFHRNRFTAGMELSEAMDGQYHRQKDVKETESLERIVDYIVAHDRAKETIMVDYRKLPQSSRKQKQYYRAAKRKDRAKQLRRMDKLFAMIERDMDGKKECSFG